MKYFLLILAGWFGMPGHAQQLPVDTTNLLEEVIVTASKFPEQRKHIAQQTIVIGSKEIARSLGANTAGLLEQSGKVFVQRSQLGGGSPVIKGFEASRIL